MCFVNKRDELTDSRPSPASFVPRSANEQLETATILRNLIGKEPESQNIHILPSMYVLYSTIISHVTVINVLFQYLYQDYFPVFRFQFQLCVSSFVGMV
jgi:hypothetical protein